MFFGTYFVGTEDGTPALIIFHRSELREYNGSPELYSPPGGVTIRKIKKLIEECKREGKDYRIS